MLLVVIVQWCNLNESPSEKEGKLDTSGEWVRYSSTSMKVPPKRKGNLTHHEDSRSGRRASMKALPKRKGNAGTDKRFSDDYEPQ